MKKYVFIVSLLFSSSAIAQLPITFPVPLAPSQVNLAITTATSLTVPVGANYAVVCAKGGAAVYETDGTTTPVGGGDNVIAAGACMPILGSKNIQNFQAIQQTGSTTTLGVKYYKYQ